MVVRYIPVHDRRRRGRYWPWPLLAAAAVTDAYPPAWATQDGLGVFVGVGVSVGVGEAIGSGVAVGAGVSEGSG